MGRNSFSVFFPLVAGIGCTIAASPSVSHAQASSFTYKFGEMARSRQPKLTTIPIPPTLPFIPTADRVDFPQPATALPARALDLPQEQFALSVAVDPRTPARNLALHNRVADFITRQKMPPPQVRIKYFKNMYNHDSPTVTGWGAHVIVVEPVQEGLIATLRVSAKHDMFLDTATLVERYLVTNNHIQFIDASPSPAPRMIFGF